MRIDRLYITAFRNLIDFEVDFDQTSSRQVIVGRNGVGKSNLLEALTWIFRDLDLEETSKFGYEVEYACNGHLVKIKCLKEGQKDAELRRFVRQYWIAPEDPSHPDHHVAKPYKEITEAEFFRRNRQVGLEANPDRLLPLYVFGYYSGAVTRFSKIFERHEERYYRDQITGTEAPLRALFQGKSHHSQFALLAFYATDDDQAKEFLRKEFRIMSFDSALFALREPYWKASKNVRRKGDARFWHAGGKVEPFLDSLFEHSLAPMSGTERLRISVGQEKKKERRYCFLPDQEALQAVASGLSNKEFFARLESLVFSDLVEGNGSDVRIWIRLADGNLATYQDLAEGERQLLTVLGLMRFTADKEALFLLDEPDTHLNPAWCLDYLENLRDYGGEPANSQIIMTTHSPLTFAGMDRNEVVILERNAQQKIYAEHPATAPKGMGFAAILTSEFFGLRSALDKETLQKIDLRRELALKTEKTDADCQRLASLNADLGTLDFSKTVRDPLYHEFIKALTMAASSNPKIKDPAPDVEIWRERQQIAKDIADKLLEFEKKRDTDQQ